MSSKTTIEHTPKLDAAELVDVEPLQLDAKNPRLLQYGIRPNASQDEILEILWERMAVDEVAMSIAVDGFWGFEPLFVVTEGGKKVVIEGNRRLAAVKLLRSSKLRAQVKATDLPEPKAAVLKSLEQVPVIPVKSREEVWRYIGFKHVNGPAKWGSYAKAQYIAFVREKTNAPLAEIAAQIGDRHKTVQRLYRALKVIEQAERAKVYKREFSHRNQFYFSHLMTALDYEGFANYLKIADKSDEAPDPIDKSRVKELGKVCRWLWGDNRDNTAPVIVSQNPDLRRLDSILANTEAIAALERGESLENAYEASKGDAIVFAEALLDAKNALSKAQARVSSGYRGEPSLLELAGTVADMAGDLAETMHKKVNPVRRWKRVKPEPAE